LKGQPFDNNEHYWLPTQNWSQGGPIIKQEGINIRVLGAGRWEASKWNHEGVEFIFEAATPLTAVMRCYVASKLGDEVEIPEQVYTQMFDNA
jgi:hypothetical protein